MNFHLQVAYSLLSRFCVSNKGAENSKYQLRYTLKLHLTDNPLKNIDSVVCLSTFGTELEVTVLSCRELS